jgi:hypothetical protein
MSWIFLLAHDMDSQKSNLYSLFKKLLFNKINLKLKRKIKVIKQIKDKKYKKSNNIKKR